MLLFLSYLVYNYDYFWQCLNNNTLFVLLNFIFNKDAFKATKLKQIS